MGEVEEGFAATLTPGDTFLIGGEVVRYEGLREMTVEVTRRADRPPKIATFMGTKFATSTQLSVRILDMFRQDDWPELPPHTRAWLRLQREVSRLPRADRLLIESFPHDGREQTVRLRLRRAERDADAGPSPDRADGGDGACARWASSRPTTRC